MRHFPSITIVCVDGRSPSLALAAIEDSTVRVGCSFADALIVTGSDQLAAAAALRPPVPVRIEGFDGLNSTHAYSAFLLKDLHRYIETEFALVVQWDGFVLDPLGWDDRFLEFDYVGARWPWFPLPHQVGNGGFSLRSRKLLDALRDTRIVPSHPEDIAIGHQYRALLEESHNIRFAPIDVADRFSFEHHIVAGAFGFHGFFNFHRVFGRDELARRLTELPDFLFGGLPALQLADVLIGSEDNDNALLTLERILRVRPKSREGLMMAARLVGRGDPCLCGSGHRFRSCCGALV